MWRNLRPRVTWLCNLKVTEFINKISRVTVVTFFQNMPLCMRVCSMYANTGYTVTYIYNYLNIYIYNNGLQGDNPVTFGCNLGVTFWEKVTGWLRPSAKPVEHWPQSRPYREGVGSKPTTTKPTPARVFRQ